MNDLMKEYVENTTTSTIIGRFERITFLTVGIEILSDAIAMGNVPKPYNHEDASLAIGTLAWELGAEAGAIREKLENLKNK